MGLFPKKVNGYVIEPGADLASVFLHGANLSGAVLIDAKLEGANLDGVTFDNTTMPDGSIKNSAW